MRAAMLPLAALALTACAADEATQILHSDGGGYHMELTLSPAEPVAGEDVTATLNVLNHHESTPVTGAAVDMTPWMPMHDHGINDEVSVSELGEGDYEGTFAFSMPGSWELRLDLDDSGELGADTAVATIEVQ